MIYSEKTIELFGALIEFQGKVNSITKDSKNPHFKSKYATLDAIIEEIRPPLAECGLGFTQHPTTEGDLITRVFHKSGEFMESTIKVMPERTGPQPLGSSITYARRYSLGAILGLALDEDDDGNKGQEKPKKPYLNENDKAYNDVHVFMTNAENKKEAIKKVESKYKLSKKIKDHLLSLESESEWFDKFIQWFEGLDLTKDQIEGILMEYNLESIHDVNDRALAVKIKGSL